MLIGDRQLDNKLYRGIKHYNHIPLTSEDIHEATDTLYMKNALFMDNLVGSGTLNEPGCIISSNGISLSTPSVVLLNGDISLIQSDEGTPLVSISEITDAGFSEGLVCVVGWYQHLNSYDTLRNYGGVRNSEIPNDLVDEKLNIQVSTRYQLRWDTVILDASTYEESDTVQFSLLNRDAAGEVTSGYSTITAGPIVSNIRIADSKPTSMDYAESELFLIPILTYKYSNDAITDSKCFKPLKPKGTSSFIKGSEEPTGEYDEGTIWFNETTYKFKFYVPGVGFVPTASDLALMQYNNTVTLSSANTTPSDVLVDIGISSLAEGDILQVIYEGIILTEGLHYTVDFENKSITLIDFTTEEGDLITFLAMKVVDTSAATSIVAKVNTHIDTYGREGIKGHVSLSDEADNSLGADSNVAVTPKALYESSLIKDEDAGIKYKFVVEDNILYLEEV